MWKSLNANLEAYAENKNNKFLNFGELYLSLFFVYGLSEQIMTGVYLALGSNLGNRLENLERAAFLIHTNIGRIKKSSSVYETEPWGFRHPDYFLNQVLEIETGLEPSTLMSGILKIEEQLGRVRRPGKYVPRRIDIDILFYGETIVNESTVIIPHPGVQDRKFVLVPLCELNPLLEHPGLNTPVRDLLAKCHDKSFIGIYKESRL